MHPAALEEVAGEVRACTLCRLHEGRTRAVPGEGGAGGILLLGEAPGRQEDLQGRPFVGRAGGILNEALRRAGLRRGDLFVTNAVKCRPPGNRVPRADEVRACRPYLLRQVEALRPGVIVTLGGLALRALLGPTPPLRDLEGEALAFHGVPVVPTYHPAARRGREVRRRLVKDLRRAGAIARRSADGPSHERASKGG